MLVFFCYLLPFLVNKDKYITKRRSKYEKNEKAATFAVYAYCCSNLFTLLIQ